MARPMRYQGKLIIDVGRRPALVEYRERDPIFQASLRSWHRDDYAYGEGRTPELAIAALAEALGRSVEDLLADANVAEDA